MHTFRITTLVTLALVAAAGACSDKPVPTAAADRAPTADASKAKMKKGGLTMPVDGALSDGGSFKGRATITSFEYDDATKTLYAVGTLDGVAKPAGDHAYHIKDQAFRTATGLGRVNETTAAADATGMYRTVQASCDVLFLDLGPLALDLLGLTVDLSRIILDVNAVTGAGALLGNLLCALLGLLDGIAILTQILALLDSINDILSGLGGVLGASSTVFPGATSLGTAMS